VQAFNFLYLEMERITCHPPQNNILKNKAR
jgi:hypothetical protein